MTYKIRPAARVLTPLRGAALLPVLLTLSLIFALAQNQAYARGAPDSFADLAERLLPSVVNIRAVSNGQNGENSEAQPENSPENWLDRFRRRGEGPRPQRPSESAGSGFIIDADGIVITNEHVIRGANEVYVIFNDDNTEYEAEVLGMDEGVDLAVLKVKTDRKMQAVKFGNSDKARIGEWTLAIGNPLGLGGSVTAGILSGRGRDIDRRSFVEFLQTDTAINRGNSGGPLFNMDGEVIGVNSRIFSSSGGSDGIGFAVPSNLAKQVTDQLLEFGTTRRGWLGVSIQTVTPDIAESVGLSKASGAMVSNVYDGSPAGEAGLREGDIILMFNDKEVRDSPRLKRMVAATMVGSDVPVLVWRDGREEELNVVLGEREKVDFASLRRGGEEAPAKQVKSEALDSLGIEVSPITDNLRQAYKLDDQMKGIVITGVREGSSAQDKGLRSGMVIIGDTKGPITDLAVLQERVEKARENGRRSFLLHVVIEDEPSFVAVRFETKEG